MKSQYINNSHQQKAKMKHHAPKYMKPLAIVHTPRGEKPEPVQWCLNFDNVTFHLGYSAGSPRLVRM
jgi:hypothetical protein